MLNSCSMLQMQLESLLWFSDRNTILFSCYFTPLCISIWCRADWLPAGQMSISLLLLGSIATPWFTTNPWHGVTDPTQGKMYDAVATMVYMMYKKYTAVTLFYADLWLLIDFLSGLCYTRPTKDPLILSHVAWVDLSHGCLLPLFYIFTIHCSCLLKEIISMVMTTNLWLLF